MSGNQCLQETEPVDDAVVRSDLERAKQELASSEYWNQVKNVLGTDSFEVLVCLGLGQVRLQQFSICYPNSCAIRFNFFFQFQFYSPLLSQW